MKKSDRFRSVLIFGGAGFIGSNWAYRLLDTTDAKVHIFDNLSRRGVRHNLASLQKAAGNSGRLQITVGDVRDAAMVERVVRHATEIYNFAAQVAVTTSLSDPRLDFEVNVGGTFNILEAARKSGRRPFILFTSTNKVYGDMNLRNLAVTSKRYRYVDCVGVSESQPLDFHSPYGCSKGAADQYVRDYARMFDMPTVVLRMSCIAGPRQFGNEDQGWVAHFLYSALRNEPLIVYGDGRQVRDVLCVHDLLRVFEAVRAAQPITEGQIYNVGGGPSNTVSLLELIEEIERLTGHKPRHEMDHRRPGDQLIYVTDFSKLRRDTGWEPQYSVSQTLQEIWAWWKKNREVIAPVTIPHFASSQLEHVPGTAA
ncbi:MAG TPA: GDP-mannose 4,6-dehydratase [Terriglobales bacterium]|nr:GDP-mannose 4,6-dehydratase [Terriglobales bacterium]